MADQRGRRRARSHVPKARGVVEMSGENLRIIRAELSIVEHPMTLSMVLSNWPVVGVPKLGHPSTPVTTRVPSRLNRAVFTVFSWPP